MIWSWYSPNTKLIALFDGLEAKIRAGQLEDLREMQTQLERNLARLMQRPEQALSQAQVTALRRRAGDLADLLKAAMQGLREARKVQSHDPGFTSYDASGRQTKLASSRNHFERRE